METRSIQPLYKIANASDVVYQIACCSDQKTNLRTAAFAVRGRCQIVGLVVCGVIAYGHTFFGFLPIENVFGSADTNS